MIVKVLWASSSGQTQGDRANLHVNFFFRVLIVDRGQRASKEEAEDAASTSMKNRSQTDRKSTKIDENLILGGFGRSKPFRGRTQDVIGTTASRPRVDLGTPRVNPRRPGNVLNHAQAGPETPSDSPGTLSERVQCIRHCRTRLRNDFSMFLSRCAKARGLKFVRPRSVS